MAQTHYESLCPKGQRMNVQAKELALRLTQVVRILLDQEAYDEGAPTVARYKAELATTKKQRDEYDVRLMRHVAHCTAGCKRASGGPLAFAAVNQAGAYDRAPSHHKPSLPGAGELAARLRDGTTLEDLAAEFERSTATLRHLLTNAGFHSTTGRPNHRPTDAVGLALVRIDDQPWAGDALCAQTDPEAFYPERGGSTSEAKAVCAGCLVQAECLDYALDHDERFGVWGGLSERERRHIKQRINHPLNTHQESA